ncbi:MAG: ATP-dependent helicase [Deltaproteobacteria bacterium]|nr:ATP-dependent helicase [Deltaproteobacteria bacterium]
MSDLNPQQMAIVNHLDGPALVIAGAGSGKTRVIIHRAARLIERGVDPAAILLMTFTNKAAEEMGSRLEGLLAGRGVRGRVLTGTFHSVANRFLRRYAPLAGYQNNFSILDDSDSRDMLKAAMTGVVREKDKRFPTAAVVQDLVSLAFNRQINLAQLVERDFDWLQEFLPELLVVEKEYRRKKKANNAMDFDDLLGNWRDLLEKNPHLEMAAGLRYLMVDEYQDTNLAQGEIVQLLGRDQKNLMVVGDDAQSIYSWRGAHVENILEFPQRFGAAVYRLEENYRSTPDILELANCSIAHNQARLEKSLRAVAPAGEPPHIMHLYDQSEEAEWVISRISAYQDQDIPLGDMGVLYRNHAQSIELQMRLSERGIPFVVRSGVKFFEQAHIKDVLAFLKVVFNPLDEISWLRILKMLPGIGNVSAAKIYGVFRRQQAIRISTSNEALQKVIPAKAKDQWSSLARCLKEMLADGVTPAQMIGLAHSLFYRDHLLLTFDNPREREEDLQHLARFAEKHRSLEGFLGRLALVGGTVIRDHEEQESPDEDHLTLTTIHQAKGLEWRVVFMLGLVEGQFPHSRCLDSPERLEEERRLFYVAVTRAKRHLEITVPQFNVTYGQWKVCRPSRFVEELPPGVAQVTRGESLENALLPDSESAGFSFDF